MIGTQWSGASMCSTERATTTPSSTSGEVVESGGYMSSARGVSEFSWRATDLGALPCRSSKRAPLVHRLVSPLPAMAPSCQSCDRAEASCRGAAPDLCANCAGCCYPTSRVECEEGRAKQSRFPSKASGSSRRWLKWRVRHAPVSCQGASLYSPSGATAWSTSFCARGIHPPLR